MENTIYLMIQPGWMLSGGIAFLALLAWIFLPEKGMIARMKKIRMMKQKVLLEDALKYLFDCEYKKIPCDLNGIAGNLNIPADRTAGLLDRLHGMGLVNLEDHSLSLSDTGRSYALRIIRVHRVWEQYLAEETGVGERDWHREADRLEHVVSKEDTEKIAASIGHPVFDPHGDPIPTAEGDLPDHQGQPLSSLKEGQIARITHIEDEPFSIYEQLVVLGLYPGMQVYVIRRSDDKIVFAAEGEECVLTPLFASALTVEKIEGEVTPTPKYELLSTLRIGERAEIAGISANCRGQQRRRLMDLGFVPGSPVSAEMRSASGDPTGYRVMGTTVGIRKTQAEQIFIQKVKKSSDEPAA